MISPDELERYFRGRAHYAGAYGYASRSWKVPNTLTMRFNTASVTRLFTAEAMLQLIDRGALAFDTPIVDFLQLKGTTISPVFSSNLPVNHLIFRPAWGVVITPTRISMSSCCPICRWVHGNRSR